MIIDGSYNGGFEAICRGIDSLVPFAPTHRIILLLGDMRELGEHTEEIHERL
jgi:UDP-N-acetylmuramyl pentapeptide synthase